MSRIAVLSLLLLCACAAADPGPVDGSTVGQDGGSGDAALGDREDAASGDRDDAALEDYDALPGPDRSGSSGSDAAVAADSGPSSCALPQPFDLGASYARELFVATNGDDGADGSSATPFRTITAAARRATPGTRIRVRAGTYRGSTYLDGSSVQGTATQPIAITGESGAILDAGGEGEVMHVSDPRYFVLEGLTLQGGRANGLNIDDGGSYDTPAEHVVLRDLTVRQIGTGGNNDCIKMSGVDRFFVLGSDVSGCNAGDAIDMVGCHEGVIAGNRFHDTPGSGGIQAKGGSSDTLIHGNRFEDVGGRSINAGGSTDLQFFRPIDAPYEAARLRAIANVFVRSGVASGAAIAYVGCDACVFANNTIIEPRTWIARILQETTGARFVPSRNGLFVDNLIVFALGDLRSGVFVNVGGNTAPETFTFGSNLWYATDTPSFAGPRYTDGIPPETGSVIQQDPLLVDGPGGGDLHLRAGSPAAGAGRMVPGTRVPDYDGRCYREPPAIGAFEMR